MAKSRAAKKDGDKASSNSVHVAVIGDVGVDWAFLSNQPARSQTSLSRPWTQYPTTALFTFPGGAWFFGHMVKGALHYPRYLRSHCAELKADDAPKKTDFEFKGGIAQHPIDFGNASLTSVWAQHAYIYLVMQKGRSARILINDTRLEEISSDTAIRFSVPKLLTDPGPYVRMGMHSALFECACETSAHPGRIIPDQVSRHYTMNSVAIVSKQQDESADAVIPENDLQLFLRLYWLSISGTIPFDVHRKNNSGTWEPLLETPRSITSLRCLEPTEPSPTGPLYHIYVPKTPHTPCLYFSEAVADITAGSFNVTRTTHDEGKTNTWHHTSTASIGPVKVRLLHCESPPNNLQLWIYENPSGGLATQRPSHLVHTLSELHPFDIGTSGISVYRRKNQHGIDGPQFGYPTVLDNYCSDDPNELTKKWSAPSAFRLVIVDDDGHGFCSMPHLWQPFLFVDRDNKDVMSGEELLHKCKSDEAYRQQCSKFLEQTIIIVKAAHWLQLKKSPLLSFLQVVDAAARTVLVVSGESLRGGLINVPDQPGIKLSKTASWERTLEDFCAALADERLGVFEFANHFVVRLGLEAVLYCRPSGEKTNGHNIDLFFDPARIEGEYAPAQHGSFPGLTTALTSYLAKEIVSTLRQIERSHPGHELSLVATIESTINRSLGPALGSARRYFDLGYGPTRSTIQKFERLQLPMSRLFSKVPSESLPCDEWDEFSHFEGNTSHIDGSTPWSILNNCLRKPGTKGLGGEPSLAERLGGERYVPVYWQAFNALMLGRRIVVDGIDSALADRHTNFPYLRFGELLSVDRGEIEGIRSLQAVLEEYILHPDRKTPISVGVFGPPGSGKSFGVRQLAEQISQNRVTEFTFNMAQFNDFREVTRLLLKVRDAGFNDRLPLVFFDEFDTVHNQQPLGWLKYFLAPMQDGQFQHDDVMMSIGKAIFVFAGGIAASHAEFGNEDFWAKRNSGSDSSGIFISAKGPDFLSRLRGHLDITGINPHIAVPVERGTGSVQREPDELEMETFTYVIRRALLIRQKLESLDHETKQAKLLDIKRRARVDSDVLDALLMTKRYVHGTRSLRAILEMSAVYSEHAITKTVVPAQSQCMMHVDPTFFTILRKNFSQLRSRILETVLSSARRATRE